MPVYMKQSVIVLSLFCFLYAPLYAKEVSEETERKWTTHSYQYGMTGKNCTDIYINYGTPEFTVNSDDSETLRKLFEACTVGQKNRNNGKNDLPSLLKK